MRISDFDYKYPEELVAQRPPAKRDSSRMLVVNRWTRSSIDSSVTKLPSFLNNGDLIVVNDTKVFPARLIGEKASGGEAEILLLEKAGRDELWTAIATRQKRLKPGTKIKFDERLTGEIIENRGKGIVIQFYTSATHKNVEEIIWQIGLPPLPPYIIRKERKDYTKEDRDRYQTIYAKNIGSSAAPTAGLHLTEEIISECKKKGVRFAPLTLHIGLDTFAPIRTDNIEKHKMHGEKYSIPDKTINEIMRAKKHGGRVVAIGTTTVRALESAFGHNDAAAGPFVSHNGAYRWPHLQDKTQTAIYNLRSTNLFIYPGYKFKVVDAMLTNFHQPKSTLLMLVSAFAGTEFILQMYEEAIKKRYKLFSYGDCMLIL